MEKNDFFSLMLSTNEVSSIVREYFLQFSLSEEQMNQAINSQYQGVFVESICKRQNATTALIDFKHPTLESSWDFYSALLTVGSIDELLEAYFLNWPLSKEQMHQASKSIHCDLFVECIHKRLFPEVECQSPKIGKEGGSEEPVHTNISKIEEVEEVALSSLEQSTEETVETGEVLNSQLPPVYLMDIRHCRTFNIPKDDQISNGVRAAIDRVARRLQEKHIVILGQLSGKTQSDLEVTKNDYEVVQKNLFIRDGFDITKRVDGFSEDIERVAAPFIAQSIEKEKALKLAEQQKEMQHLYNKVLYLSLKEASEYCKNIKHIYGKFNRSERGRISRLMKELYSLTGAKTLNEVKDLVLRENFFTWFDAEKKTNEAYYAVFCKFMHEACGM